MSLSKKAEELWEKAQQIEDEFESSVKSSRMSRRHIIEERRKVRAIAAAMRKEAAEYEPW